MLRDQSMDVAIVGMSGRFPKCDNITQLWSAIKKGEILTTRYTRDELLQSGVSEELIDNPNFVPVHGHLTHAEQFDNIFFKISPRDAEIMDPQHRLMLEVAWTALEDAGIKCLKDGRNSIGVFASGSGNSYFRHLLSQGPLESHILEQAIHGNDPDFIASLIAYKLNLTGPTVGIQTACSSSLVAVHFAIQALLNGDCDYAMVVSAGVAFPQVGYMYSSGGIKSASGQCRPFDISADGVVEGSGVACLVLKRYQDTDENTSRPYGIILSSAVNNDGNAKVGYFAPSVIGQANVIESAVRSAAIDVNTIGYLETHGTGTLLGDPIEWTASSNTYAQLGAKPNQIAIGALKANIGHLDAAAGLTALIKAALVVKEGIIPPLVGFSKLNPHLNTYQTPFYIPIDSIEWRSEHPRRAAISAFGIGGTNAHIVLEEPPCILKKEETTSIEKQSHLITLSCNDVDALKRASQNLGHFVNETDTNINDVAYTLIKGRVNFSKRIIVCGEDRNEISTTLINKKSVIHSAVPNNELKSLIFMFPGQGIQYPGMSVEFEKNIPEFSEKLDQCLNVFKPSIRNRVANALRNYNFSDSEFNETDLAQPAIFAFEYALFQSLKQFNITPTACVGHSLGEITAACCAGALDLENAANLVIARGQFMHHFSAEGAMLVLNCSQENTEQYIRKSNLPIYLVSINSPESCVVGGSVENIDQFEKHLNDSVLVKRLRTSRAFHTPMIEPAIIHLREFVTNLFLSELQLPMAINTDGKILLKGRKFENDYFVKQARQSVRFIDSIASLKNAFSDAIYVEIGPRKTLTPIIKSMKLGNISFSGNGVSKSVAILHGLGTFWAMGYPIKLDKLYNKGRLLQLPTYPFLGPKFIAPEVIAGTRYRVSNNVEEINIEKIQKINVLNAEPIDYKNTNTITKMLTKIWVELLSYESVDSKSDFFDLGGDSLLMITLINKIENIFSTKISPRSIIAARTLEKQVNIIHQSLCIAE